jgi:endonuclease YncB( thermonuclease family)
MYEYRVKEVVRVVDGDTVDLILDLGFGLFKKERVRIAGVDTPEKRTRNLKEKQLGCDATDFVEKWFAVDGEIVVRTEKDGKYGRLLGWIHRDNACLNHEIIDGGWGWAYTGGTKVDTEDMASLMLLLNKRGYDTWEDYAER